MIGIPYYMEWYHESYEIDVGKKMSQTNHFGKGYTTYKHADDRGMVYERVLPTLGD